MKKRVVDTNQLDWSESSHGERFAARRKKLTQRAGGHRLGASLYEVPPGKTAFPRHYHLANEEAIFVLEGRGTMRLGDEEYPIGAGCYVALPVGGDSAHQLVNTSDAPLRYLCVSTMREPDVSIYPDSNKVGIFAGAAPGGPDEERTYQAYLDAGAAVAYWDDE